MCDIVKLANRACDLLNGNVQAEASEEEIADEYSSALQWHDETEAEEAKQSMYRDGTQDPFYYVIGIR